MEYKILLAWNAIVLSIYGLDKFHAVNRKWRVSEANMLAMAFSLGGVGALLGMIIFRHKTRRKKFLIWVPISIILNVATVYLLNYLTRMIEL